MTCGTLSLADKIFSPSACKASKQLLTWSSQSSLALLMCISGLDLLKSQPALCTVIKSRWVPPASFKAFWFPVHLTPCIFLFTVKGIYPLATFLPAVTLTAELILMLSRYSIVWLWDWHCFLSWWQLNVTVKRFSESSNCFIMTSFIWQGVVTRMRLARSPWLLLFFSASVLQSLQYQYDFCVCFFS